MRKTICIFCLLLSGCAGSLPRAIEQIRTGMDKDQVLETAGNPQRTFRETSQDHWIYVYFNGEQQVLRDVTFEDGKVAQISRPIVGQEPWVKDLEKSKSMEEYEQKARTHNQNNHTPQKSGGG